MLVLEKDINLRQLKKYGFEHSVDNAFWVCIPHPTWGGSIWIEKKTRYVEVFEDDDFGQGAIEVFYDLVVDGLIKKVKD